MSSRRSLTLHEIATVLEEDDDFSNQRQDFDIFLLPPDTANDYQTDEDSGEEDNVSINNLPGSLLRAPAELAASTSMEKPETEDQTPPEFQEPLKKRVMNYNWRKRDLQLRPIVWKPLYHTPIERSPIEWFSLLFSEEVFEMLTIETNRYLARKLLSADVKIEEMKCLVGILLVSGYCQVSRRRMYWENASDSRNSLIASALSRDRFTLIYSNIHVADNLNLDTSDKFAKVRPLLKVLTMRFLEHCPHKENHSVDEAMVPYFGHHGCKQFIRGKPIRYGYKLWVGATSGGYIAWFEPYQGASTFTNAQYSQLGLGASVVLSYADQLATLGYGKNYHLFIDNFFTGLPLVHELTERGFRVTGTIRENRSGKCPLLSNKEAKTKERGFYDYRISDDIIICKWHDNSIVSVCSNAVGVDPVHKTERYSQQLKKKISVSQPHLIQQYNKNMGGVDLSDQNISSLRTSIRGKKWYMPLILHCIDMSVQNAWLLYRHNGGNIDLLNFRRRIANYIIDCNKQRERPGPSRPSSITSDSRYDGKEHYVSKQEKRTRYFIMMTRLRTKSMPYTTLFKMMHFNIRMILQTCNDNVYVDGIFKIFLFAVSEQMPGESAVEHASSRAFNLTSCEEFEQGARFDPHDVIDSLWRKFYFWAKGMEISAILFSLPSDKVLN
ncbi:unnamed protein product [Parnassius apollo]|uniref:(apollo) hypothetical protein n=1 Tax=Parnassius apollo TaxID=110799 RepID=A0A8S3XF87_PARAO|nr:unnamed protein product [Parnassius apollo]